MDCGCEHDEHVTPLEDTDDVDSAEEFDRHTDAYKDAWAEKFEEIGPCKSHIGETKMGQWEKENHPKLCCEHRHKSRAHMLDFAD